MSMATPLRRKRWFRLSLRSLMVLVAIVGVTLAPVTYRLRVAAKQKRILQTLESHGWGWLYEWNSDPMQGPLVPLDRWRPPEWAENLLGSDFFYDVTWVRAPRSVEAVLSQSDFRLIAQLPSLRRIDLGEFPTDAQLAELRYLRKVEWLDLDGSSVTNAGLVYLEKYSKLTHLRLGGTQINDDGLEHLSSFANLDSLKISYTQVTGRGLQHLRTLKRLSNLEANGTPLDGTGFEHLQELPLLSTLSLADSAISNASVDKLQSLTQVTSLHIYDTKITKEGAAAIQKRLPAHAVYSDEERADLLPEK